MIITIYFFFLSIRYYKTKSVGLIISILLMISGIGAILVNCEPKIETMTELLNLMYILLILSILISGLSKFKKITKIQANKTIDKVANIIIVLSIFSLSINLYALIYTYSNLFSISFEQFKNTDTGNEFQYTIPISHTLLTIATFITPLSFFLIGLTYYYSSIKKTRKSLLCFILSFNITVQGFTIFSRSWMIINILVLLVSFLITIRLLNLKKLLPVFILFISLLVVQNVLVTEINQNRFSNYYVRPGSYIKEPIAYSVVDYLSMWQQNSITVLSNYYSIESIQFASATNRIGPFLISYFQILGSDNVPASRSQIWPYPYYYTFNGLVTDLVFDFGYIFTFVLSIFYRKFCLSISPTHGEIKFENYVLLLLLMTAPLLFFSNIIFGMVFMNLALIYAVSFRFYTRKNSNKVASYKFLQIS